MLTWTQRSRIYEINTWVWLYELSRRYKRPIHLGNVPAQDWDGLRSLGVDAVWLMGVWERSPAGIAISNKNIGLQDEFHRVLPDFTQDDNVGSPYCVRRYVVDEHLGRASGLATARKQLADRGMRLILDFVPNHVAPDHPWVMEHPEYFIQGSPYDLIQKPGEFFKASDAVLALGRDPYFAPWPDVAQLNGFHPVLRKAIIETVGSIAQQCDGMRCDMAMLLMTPIFERTWGHRAGPSPEKEYWPEVIQAVRKRFPDVLFMAEAYWDKEWELQQQGFDYCYDKRLYDRLEHDQAESVRLHLCADLPYQEKLVRFIENHDEPRAAATFSLPKQQAAAVTVATLPGAKLFHQGQFEGHRVKLPVFLRRGPAESAVPALQAFYRQLLTVIKPVAFREGEWRLCERTGWPGSSSHQNLVAWCWRKGEDRHLIVVNLSDNGSQGHVLVPWDDVSGRSWRLTDAFTGEVYERDGNELRSPGLYVDLQPWGFHVLSF
jgi:Alpha amylase, catalytic domain